jgi:hypothetical protein
MTGGDFRERKTPGRVGKRGERKEEEGRGRPAGG